jgi:hypothetical protein
VHVGGAAAERIGNWAVDKTADVQAKYASNTDGAPIQVAGNYDWSGSYEAFGPTPAVQSGAFFTFAGIFEPSSYKGVYSAASGTIVDRVEIAWDQEGGSLIRHTCNFAANGILTAGTVAGTPAEDASTPVTSSSSGCLVHIATPAAIPSYAELANVRSVRFAMMRDNKPYHASTTGQAPNRVKGNFSAELSIDLYIDDPTETEALVNSMQFVKLFVDDSETLFWEIKSMMFGGTTGIGAPRESADLVAVTVNAAFSGYHDISGTLTKGAIEDPELVNWWGD